MKQQIPVYVISLESAAARRRHIINHLENLGVEFEIIDGVEGSKLSEEEIANFACGEMTKNRGHVGCGLSHLNIYNKMIQRSEKSALILEDDVILDEKVCELLELDLGKFDFLYLGCHREGSISTSDHRPVFYDAESVREISNSFKAAQLSHPPHGTHAYCISLPTAKKRVAELLPFQVPVDQYHLTENEYKFEAVVQPRLTWFSPESLLSHTWDSSEFNKLRENSSSLSIINIIKSYKFYYTMKNLLKLTALRERLEIRRQIQIGHLSPGKWNPLPWQDYEFLCSNKLFSRKK